MKKLTEKAYWDATYQEREAVQPVKVSGARNLSNAQILRIKQRHGGGFNSVLEIGGGGSAWLAYLALTYPNGEFSALDYSDDGARLLSEFIRRHSLQNLKIFQEDFFAPSAKIGTFDFVYSQGVVEHFEDLAGTLRAHARFLSKTGRMFTLIPNMAGVLGPLTRWMNRSVYDIHIVHDLDSFVDGHRRADLDIVESGYLGSINFGVLSSCVRDRKGWKWHAYKLLSRLTTLVWLFEDKIVELPATRSFAPYIFVVSQQSRDS